MIKHVLMYIWEKRGTILCFTVCAGCFAVVFRFYDIPGEAVIYSVILSVVVGLLFAIAGSIRKCIKLKKINDLYKNTEFTLSDFPSLSGETEKAYAALAISLKQANRDLNTDYDKRIGNMKEYYALWAHQIKTPIAAMRLLLQTEQNTLPADTAEELNTELQKTEQYVEMVLGYMKIDSEETDFLFATYDIDAIIRPIIRKNAGQFIRKKLKLNYESLTCAVLTDEKWLSFVIEQVLSNALKYTREGGISIYIEEDKTLVISDTGIGIAPEDVPRVFDRGYTGYNGRTDKKSTGIGLYLCKKITDRLGHAISVTSQPGKGTQVKIFLNSCAAISD